MLKSGFNKVIAVDSSPEIKTLSKDINNKKFSFILSDFKDFNLTKNTYNIINAQYALPFYGKKGFRLFIQKIIKSLQKDGIFVGQFFGIEDEWNTKGSNLVFQTEEEAKNLLKKLKLIEFIKEKKIAKTAAGQQKSWHVFHFIAKKNYSSRYFNN